MRRFGSAASTQKFCWRNMLMDLEIWASWVSSAIKRCSWGSDMGLAGLWHQHVHLECS